MLDGKLYTYNSGDIWNEACAVEIDAILKKYNCIYCQVASSDKQILKHENRHSNN